MISPELLRRYPFFGQLKEPYLKTIAMFTEEEHIEEGMLLFEDNQPANYLHFLITGSIELHFRVKDKNHLHTQKDFYVGQINPGEPFGISALIQPYCYTSTAIASEPCHILKIKADELRSLCEENAEVAAVLMFQLARTAMMRLHDTRIQLIASQS